MRNKGFTLVELIVVIAIIAVLAAIVAPVAFQQIAKARVSGTLEDMRSVKTALTAEFSDVGSWMPAWGANCTTASNPLVTTNNCAGGTYGQPPWDGPYLERWPAGRWASSAYTYNWVAAAGGTGTGAPVHLANCAYLSLTFVADTNARNSMERAIDGNGTCDIAGDFQCDAATPATVYYILRQG